MTVIIDASVLSAFILEETDHEKIRKLLMDGTFAPELILTESTNAVITALRRGRLEKEQSENAIGVLVDFIGSNVRILPLDKNLVLETFRIAMNYNLTSYDALYIGLAKRIEASLASRDPKQLEAAKKFGVKTLTA